MAEEFDWTKLIPMLMGGFGAYAGSQAGKDNTTTQTTQMNPQQQAQWDSYASFANQVANRPYQNTIVPFSQDQYEAMDKVRNASGGTQEMGLGSQALQGFLSGGQQNPFMGDNPYLQSVIDQTNDSVQNRMGTGAFSSGSFGNAGVGQATAKALANNEGNLRYQNYQNSGNLAENALNRTASMVPQALNYQNQYFNNASQQLQTGGMQQALGQNMMNNWWQYPMQQLSIMGQPLNLGQGSTTTLTQPGNQLASTIGGGLLGLKLGSAF